MQSRLQRGSVCCGAEACHRQVLPALQDHREEFLLKELYKRWCNHKVMVRWLSRFFNYLDRCVCEFSCCWLGCVCEFSCCWLGCAWIQASLEPCCVVLRPSRQSYRHTCINDGAVGHVLQWSNEGCKSPPHSNPIYQACVWARLLGTGTTSRGIHCTPCRTLASCDSKVSPLCCLAQACRTQPHWYSPESSHPSCIAAEEVYVEVRGRARTAALAAVEAERGGEAVDRTLLKNVLGIFIEVCGAPVLGAIWRVTLYHGHIAWRAQEYHWWTPMQSRAGHAILLREEDAE